MPGPKARHRVQSSGQPRRPQTGQAPMPWVRRTFSATPDLLLAAGVGRGARAAVGPPGALGELQAAGETVTGVDRPVATGLASRDRVPVDAVGTLEGGRRRLRSRRRGRRRGGRLGLRRGSGLLCSRDGRLRSRLSRLGRGRPAGSGAAAGSSGAAASGSVPRAAFTSQASPSA